MERDFVESGLVGDPTRVRLNYHCHSADGEFRLYEERYRNGDFRFGGLHFGRF